MRFVFRKASFVEEGNEQREIFPEPAQDVQSMSAIVHALVFFVFCGPVLRIVTYQLRAAVFHEEIGLGRHAAGVYMMQIEVSFAVTLQEVRRHEHGEELVGRAQQRIVCFPGPVHVSRVAEE